MKIFIGYDKREDIAYRVCEYSLRRNSSVPLDIEPISSDHPLYARTWHEEGADRIDDKDKRPFSTDFAFARFLVPAAMDYKGWAMFIDSDFLFKGDVAELFDYAQDCYAAMCVHHNFWPQSPIKKDGAAQAQYWRKCWSSLVLWNCEHDANRWLTPEQVNTLPGRSLHQFMWLNDHDIGELPEEWNWLEGHSAYEIRPKGVHFTSGGPWLPYRQNMRYAGDWLREKDVLESSIVKESGNGGQDRPGYNNRGQRSPREAVAPRPDAG